MSSLFFAECAEAQVINGVELLEPQAGLGRSGQRWARSVQRLASIAGAACKNVCLSSASLLERSGKLLQLTLNCIILPAT